MDAAAVSIPARTALEGYLEVLNFAQSDHKMGPADLHAGFEWAMALENIAQNATHSAEILQLAQTMKSNHQLPWHVVETLEEALQSPASLLLRRLLQKPQHRKDWPLKVLAAHLSACALPYPHHTADVHTTVHQLRQASANASMLEEIFRSVGSPARALELANHAPSWLRSPHTIAAEHVAYFSSPRALNAAAAAELLKLAAPQNEPQTAWSDAPDAAAAPLLSAGAQFYCECLAMALCLAPITRSAEKSRLPPQPRLPGPAAPAVGGSAAVTWHVSVCQSLKTVLQSSPQLVLEVPPPVLAKASRRSFEVASSVAQALSTLRQEQGVSIQVLTPLLRHYCLLNDHTALFFKSYSGDAIPLHQ